MDELEQKVQSEAREPEPAGAQKRGTLPSRRAFLIISLLGLVFMSLFVFGYRHYLHRQRVVEAAAGAAGESLPIVNVEKVRRAPGTVELRLPGNVIPVTEAYIYARASGYVRRRHVDIGDTVRSGQLLAEIEAPELDQQVQQARAAVAQAEKQLDQAKADLADARAKMDLARVTWDRFKVLMDHGAVSRQEGDNQLAAFRSTSATVTSYEARIGSAEQNVRAARANLERLSALQDFEKVRAPFNGVITARNFDVGALISGSGSSMGQSQSAGAMSGPSAGSQGGELFRIAQTAVLRVLVSVPESSAPGIRTGQPAVVTVEAFPKREFTGRITRTANAVDINSRTMLTEIQVQNPSLLLLPGMFVEVRLLSARAEPPLVIRGDGVIATAKGLRVAVLMDPQAKEQHSRPYPPQAKRVHMQEIQVGRDYGQEIEVVSGLQGWEYIVLNPGDEIEEGALVQPVSAPEGGGTAGGPRPAGSEREAAPRVRPKSHQ